MRVLIIESDPSFADAASEALRAQGAKIQVVDDGQEGMEAARADRPDALILSVELGDKAHAGFSICNRIKKDDELKEIPLLLVSANATEETFEQHRKLRTRADAYLRKPFEQQAFLRAIDVLLPGLGGDGAPAPSEATERFGWSGFASASATGRDEPLFDGADGTADEDLDLTGLLQEEEGEKAWVTPVPVARTNEVKSTPAPAADGEELARLRRALEAAETARDEAREAGQRAEAMAREAQAAREEAERKLEALSKRAQEAEALQAEVGQLQASLQNQEAELRALRERLEQVEQVRQRTQKALRVASELLESIK